LTSLPAQQPRSEKRRNRPVSAKSLVDTTVPAFQHLRYLFPENRAYALRYEGDNKALISGHPVFCPEPVLINIHGSTWGGAMLKEHFVGRGMHLEFDHPDFELITTSVIEDVTEKRAA